MISYRIRRAVPGRRPAIPAREESQLRERFAQWRSDPRVDLVVVLLLLVAGLFVFLRWG